MNWKKKLKTDSSHTIDPTGFIDFSSPKKSNLVKEYNSEAVEIYTALGAYGYQNAIGYAEGHYNTISKQLAFHFSDKDKIEVLDLGCGPGRIIYDCADHFRNGEFIGVDYSPEMIKMASKMLKTNDNVIVDASKKGYAPLTLKPKNLSNVTLCKADACDLPFINDVFDCVISSYLIDRVSDPYKMLEESVRVLKPLGLFIFSSPLNFTNKNLWNNFSLEKISDIISQCNISIEEIHDGMVWRQPIDSRGNYTDWKTLFIKGTKTGIV